MVYINTFLNIADNTGPKQAKCLNIKKKPIGFLADIILIVIKKRFLKKKKNKKKYFI